MATVISETFDVSANGWNVIGDAAGFTYVPVVGAQGGFISATDLLLGETWYFTAGPAFTGDLSAFAGGTLSYDLLQVTTANPYDDIDVLIVGATRTIALDLPIDAQPGTEYTPYSLDLTGDAGWFDTLTRTPLSTDDIAEVLGDVVSLRIRGEYQLGGDQARLDNVMLTSVSDVSPGSPPDDGPAPYRDGFAGGDDGWRITADGRDAIWQPTGGKTNGYLQASDRPSGDTWYFKTPEGFAGDYSAFLGGALAYSLFQTSLSSQFDASEDVRLIANSGQILAVDLPDGTSNPGLDWTDYRIDLTATGGWFDTMTDQGVSAEEIAAVLADLASIEIRGEFKVGGDTAGLDDFALLGAGQVIEDFSSAGGNGPDVLPGTPGADEIDGGLGDDLITGGLGDDTLTGGEGTDTAAYSGDQDSYTLRVTPNGLELDDRRPGAEGTDTLTGFEFLDFAGGSVFDPGDSSLTLFDLRQFADFATLNPEDFTSFVEMYIAYFDRAPDAVGLFFWGSVLAQGALTLEQIADDFFTQVETQALYPDLGDNTTFVSSVYENVLGRDIDQVGLDFWVGLLERAVEPISQSRFILDFLGGVDAPPQPGNSPETIAQRAIDAQYLADKTELGLYFSTELGMSDRADAIATMALFDGSAASAAAARMAMETDYAEALAPDTGDFLMQLVGILDDSAVM